MPPGFSMDDYFTEDQPTAAMETPNTASEWNRFFARLHMHFMWLTHCRVRKFYDNWIFCEGRKRWVNSSVIEHGPSFTDAESEADKKAGRRVWVVFLASVVEDTKGEPIKKGDIAQVLECEARWMESEHAAERLTEAEVDEVIAKAAAQVREKISKEEAERCLIENVSRAAVRLWRALSLHEKRSSGLFGS